MTTADMDKDRTVRALSTRPSGHQWSDRASWDEYITKERADGSQYTAHRTVDRWGCSFSFGPWQIVRDNRGGTQ